MTPSDTPYTDIYDPGEPGKASDSATHALERLCEAIAKSHIANDDVVVERLRDLIGDLNHSTSLGGCPWCSG